MTDSTSKAMNGIRAERPRSLALLIPMMLAEGWGYDYESPNWRVAPGVARRSWTQGSAMDWLAKVAEGRERHGLQACSAFSFLLGIGASNIAHALMASIRGRLNRDNEQAEAKI